MAVEIKIENILTENGKKDEKVEQLERQVVEFFRINQHKNGVKSDQ